jgi:hypothetical protein
MLPKAAAQKFRAILSATDPLRPVATRVTEVKGNVLLKKLVAIALALSASAIAMSDEPIETITLRHVNWGYPAFYQWASDEISTSAETAVQRFCSEINEAFESPDFIDNFRTEISDVDGSKAIGWAVENYWLCAVEKHAFLVAVGGTGETYKFGMICAEMDGLVHIKYFSEILLRRHKTCVDVDWDDESQRHSVAIPDDE